MIRTARLAEKLGESIHATAGTLWLTVEVIHTDWQLFTDSVDMSRIAGRPEFRSKRPGSLLRDAPGRPDRDASRGIAGAPPV